MANGQHQWSELLRKAVNEPGTINVAYSAFYQFSLGNQLLAMFQCIERNIEPGPIATYPGWLSKRRYVKKGEKALTLCMPITIKKKGDKEEQEVITAFVYKPHWFVLSQTNGEEYQAPELPDWNREKALETLGIKEVEFSGLDGNCQGYAFKYSLAVSPLAFNHWKTFFHECGHIMLGHTMESQLSDDEKTPRDIREVEAEAVAMLLCESLNLGGEADSRGYIQSWLGDNNEISEKSAQRIFAAADKILRAGKAASTANTDGE